MSDTVTTAYSAALDGMQRTGPKRLHELAAMLGDDPGLADGSSLINHLRDAGAHQFPAPVLDAAPTARARPRRMGLHRDRCPMGRWHQPEHRRATHRHHHRSRRRRHDRGVIRRPLPVRCAGRSDRHR